MKKMKRWIAIVLVVLMSLPLCGCQMLDEMRSVQAKVQEDGSIIWNGVVYREFVWVPEGVNPLTSIDLEVTEADVPVLLSSFFGSAGDVSPNGIWLQARDPDGYDWLLYCREDMYEQMVSYVEENLYDKEPELTQYYQRYYSMDTYAQEYLFLTTAQTNAVNHILATVESGEVDDDFYDRIQYEHSVNLDSCDQYQVFGEYNTLEIVVGVGRYFLIERVHETKWNSEWEEFYDEVYEYAYKVPSEYNEIIKEIVDAEKELNRAYYE